MIALARALKEQAVEAGGAETAEASEPYEPPEEQHSVRVDGLRIT